MLLLPKFFDVVVEPVEPLVPQLLEAGHPVMDRFEAARIEAIEPLPSGFADTNEPDLTQHAQVLRGAGLRDAERASQLVDRSLASLEQDEYSPPL
jgi:hypothetical protein